MAVEACEITAVLYSEKNTSVEFIYQMKRALIDKDPFFRSVLNRIQSLNGEWQKDKKKGGNRGTKTNRSEKKERQKSLTNVAFSWFGLWENESHLFFLATSLRWLIVNLCSTWIRFCDFFLSATMQTLFCLKFFFLKSYHY